MAVKRFISTEMTKASWYMRLKPKYKALWVQLILSCDCAGLFEVTPELYSVFVGERITEQDLFGKFGNKVVRWKDKGLLPTFVRNQYYSARTPRLSPACKPHQFVLTRLAEVGLTEAKLDELANKVVEVQGELPLEAPKEPKQIPQRQVVPPRIEWVKDYCAERGGKVDAEKFFNYYTSKGWLVGKSKMIDWQAAVRNWERTEARSATTQVKNVLNDPNYHREGF